MKNIFQLVLPNVYLIIIEFCILMSPMFLRAQYQSAPISLDVKSNSNNWILQDGTIYERVQKPLGSMTTSLGMDVVNIISFTAYPMNITAGQTVTLTPVFENAISATIIDPNYNTIGTVVSGVDYFVTPLATGAYELVVDGQGGQRRTQTVTVNVYNGLVQFLQEGPKLVALNAIGHALQGYSVALSADGNTAIVGGPSDSSGAGAVWVWTRNGDVWSQGPKLFGSGGFPPNPIYPDQGISVSIAADGNTAIVGGRGFAWVWKRNGEVWTQQGPKLDPYIPSCGECQWLNSVAISADGNTAILGGQYDDVNPGTVGGAWVFTQTGGVWTQQGPILIVSEQINSVALSADGNTAILGGIMEDNYTGAAWIWIRSEGIWTQQGPKLVGTGVVGDALVLQGYSVFLSADGNTAIVGGPGDGNLPSDNTGAAWIWTRNGVVWTQQGPKLVGPGGASASTEQGLSVSLSADGNTATIGGVEGYSQTSTALIWTRSDGVWTHQGTKLVGSGAMGSGNNSSPGVSVSLSADGNTAIVGGGYDNDYVGAVWIFTSTITSIPVELSSFSATLAKENVILNWVTQTETNNQGFEIERKLFGSSYEKIGYVTGFGTTTEPKSYSFTDQNVTSGKYSYRLKQIDFDGTFEYSNVIEVEVDFTPKEYALYQNYPNPFNPTTTISFSIPEKSFVTLKVYDMLGREVAQLVNEELETGNFEKTFDASTLSSGVYIYRITAMKDGKILFNESKQMLLIK